MQTHDSKLRPSVRQTDKPALPLLADLVTQYAEEQQVSAAYKKLLFVVLRSLQTFAKSRKIKVLTPDDINRDLLILWRTWLLDDKKLSAHTWNNYRRHLFALLRWCQVAYQWNPGTTMQGVKGVHAVTKKDKTLEMIGLRDVMRAVAEDEISGAYPGWFWVGAMKFLYFTGIRRRQLVGMKWGDIDRKSMTILLRADTSKTKREWTIPLSPALLPVLDELQEKTTEAMADQLNRKPRRSDQLWNCSLFNPRYRGNHTDESNVSNVFRRIREKTGFEISAHKFRHTLATKLAKEGDLKELQHLLGHTNLSTTMGYVQADVTRMRGMLGGLEL